jgi:DNA-directed RNA polymerase subunit RPC12/RpoP
MRFECTKCHKKFKEKRSLENHSKKLPPCHVVYPCNKCSKPFRSQRDLDRHLNRKTPCAPTEIPVIKEDNPENRCQYCNKEYVNKQSLVRHLKTCDKEANMKIIMEKLSDLKKQVGIQAINNTTINVSTSQNLYVGNTLCCFGEEDYSLLDQNKIQTMLLEDAENFVPRLIREIHNSPDLPQNHNVFHEPKTNRTMVFIKKVVNGVTVSTWELRDLETVSQELVTKAKRYPTCMPLAQGIPPNSAKERQYCKSMQFITKEYKHSEADLIAIKQTLTNVTKNPGFFTMIEDTTHVSHLIPLN